MKPKALASSVAAILLLSSTAAIAQPIDDRPPPPSHDRLNPHNSDSIEGKPKEDDPRDEESLRKRLNQTLAFAQRIVETHEAALAQLDAGENPRDVMRELRSPEFQRGTITARRTRDGSANSGENSLKPTDAPEINQRDAKRIRNFIAEHLSSIDTQLKQVEQISPEASKRLISRLAPKILEILHLEQDDPTLATLKLNELKSGLTLIEVSGQYRGLMRSSGTSQSDLNAAKDLVRLAASDRFDAQVQIKQHEISQLMMRIQELHTALEDLNSQRDEQVESMIIAAGKNPRSHGNRRQSRPDQAADTQIDSNEE